MTKQNVAIFGTRTMVYIYENLKTYEFSMYELQACGFVFYVDTYAYGSDAYYQTRMNQTHVSGDFESYEF